VCWFACSCRTNIRSEQCWHASSFSPDQEYKIRGSELRKSVLRLFPGEGGFRSWGTKHERRTELKQRLFISNRILQRNRTGTPKTLPGSISDEGGLCRSETKKNKRQDVNCLYPRGNYRENPQSGSAVLVSIPCEVTRKQSTI
jgi:hypothetical protein